MTSAQRRMTRRACLVALALAAAPAAAAPGTAAAPEAKLEQRIGEALPLAANFVETDGSRVALAELFAGGRPVLLVLGYYRCPQLCGLLMHGVLEAVQAAGPAARRARIVAVSIDPDDTPATARVRRDADLAYASFLRTGAHALDPPPELHLLTGDAAAIDGVARATGFRAVRLAAAGAVGVADASRYAHPAALVVVTPVGRISSYLMGVRFDADALGAALADAEQGRSGSLTDRIALLCAHLDLRLGRHSAAVMDATRGVGVVLVVALAVWCWRRRGGTVSAVRR